MNNAPTFLSLFSGIGGFDLALKKEGWRCAGQVEIDPFCQRVLAVRFPHTSRWPDVREWQGDGRKRPSTEVEGFPVQVQAFQDSLGRWFALFFDGKIYLNVPLAVPEENG